MRWDRESGARSTPPSKRPAISGPSSSWATSISTIGGGRISYNTSEAGIQTMPVIHALGNWGLDWCTGPPEFMVHQELMRQEGPATIASSWTNSAYGTSEHTANVAPCQACLSKLDDAYASAVHRRHSGLRRWIGSGDPPMTDSPSPGNCAAGRGLACSEPRQPTPPDLHQSQSQRHLPGRRR